MSIKVYIAQINPTVGDLKGNQEKILNAIAAAKKSGCHLLVTPETALTGYPPEDILLLRAFIDACEKALNPIIEASRGIGLLIGTVRKNEIASEKPLCNTAAICYDGQLLGYQDKTLLPTYDVFSERRYFEPARENVPWKIGPHTVGVTICEDIWQHSQLVQETLYKSDPIADQKSEKIDIHLNLSASPFHVGKIINRFHVGAKVAQTLKCPVVLCNQVGANDSLIFDGHSFAVNAQGELVAVAKGFVEEGLIYDTAHTTPVPYTADPLQDLYEALVLGVRDYFHKSGFKKACIGLSGGIDSALVACIAKAALGSKNVLGVAMPSRYSSEGSLKDAEILAQHLGIALKTIPIEEPFKSYLELLTPHFEGKGSDITEENLQARIRGMILMALSNKLGYIVLSTGNKSELAMGYSTLYGDMCGGLAVISDLTKEQVFALAHHINKEKEIIPKSTLTKPPSAELRPGQKDSDSLPEYPIVDTVLKAYIEEGQSPEEIAVKHSIPLDTVNSLIKKIHVNEYKRRQSPPGLRVTEKAFSIGRRFPIVQKWV